MTEAREMADDGRGERGDLDAGREWMRRAWYELNAIRAREGAPAGVSEEWWSNLTDALGQMLGDDAKPWMLTAAKRLHEEGRVLGRQDAELDLAEVRRAERERAARRLDERAEDLERFAPPPFGDGADRLEHRLHTELAAHFRAAATAIRALEDE